MDLMKSLSSSRLHTRLLESLFQQESREYNPKLKKIVDIREKFDYRFNSLLAKLLVENDLDETYHIIDLLWELKEEMINLIVQREYQDMSKKAIRQELEDDEEEIENEEDYETQ